MIEFGKDKELVDLVGALIEVNIQTGPGGSIDLLGLVRQLIRLIAETRAEIQRLKYEALGAKCWRRPTLPDESFEAILAECRHELIEDLKKAGEEFRLQKKVIQKARIIQMPGVSTTKH